MTSFIRRVRGVVLYAACMVSMAVGASLVWVVDAKTSVHPPPGKPGPVRPSAAAPGDLDRLRNDAALGDGLATEILAGMLLDRYDRVGRDDDLYEALIWVDRNLYLEHNHSLSDRIASRYCDHSVVRWHPLCNPGE